MNIIIVFHLILALKTILMIGRAENKLKRFILGILAMEYIKQEIPESEMIIISYKSDNLILKNKKYQILWTQFKSRKIFLKKIVFIFSIY